MGKRDPTQKARLVRSLRAQALEDLQEGTLLFRDALLKPPACLRGASLYLVLISTKGSGPSTARKVCTEAKVWPLVPVGNMAPSAKQRVLESLPERIK